MTGAATSSSAYWVVDPDGPSITVWEVEGGRYVERVHVAGDDEYAVTAPFPVMLKPAGLRS